MSIFVFVFIAVGLLGCSTDPHPRWAGEGACQGCRAGKGPEGCDGGCEQGETKIAAIVEKKVAVSEKAKALAEKRLADLEAKVGETELKLAEAESLNTTWAKELADLRAALEGCESK